MSLRSDIHNYKQNVLPKLIAIKEFYKGLTLINAIKYASEGKNPDGKMNSHQWRIGKRLGKDGASALSKQELEIREAKTFEDIFKLTEKVRKETYGLGDLWSYDTALRIGFNKRVYPEEVYIQRGVLKGIRKLLGNIKLQRHIPLRILPQELQGFEPFEVENFLCLWGKDSIKKSTLC